MNVCPKCGLPKEACMCETLAKSSQKIRVYEDKKRYGKIVTIVEGIDEKDISLKKIAKELNSLWRNNKRQQDRAARKPHEESQGKIN